MLENLRFGEKNFNSCHHGVSLAAAAWQSSMACFISVIFAAPQLMKSKGAA